MSIETWENAHYFFFHNLKLTAAILSRYTTDARQRVSETHALKLWTDLILNNYYGAEEISPFTDVGKQRILFICIIIKTRFGKC